VQGQPGRPTPGSERGVQRRGHGGRVARHVERGSVGEPVAARRVHRVEHQLGCRATGIGEQLVEHLGQGQQGRPGVEAEAVAAVLPELAPVGVGALVQLHPVPLRGQPGGRRQPADPRPDHHHSTHRSPSLRSVGASRAAL
jgi:hypothetical protein